MRICSHLLLGISILLIACNDQDQSEQKPGQDDTQVKAKTSINQGMVKRLASLAKDADPLSNYHLNSQRAAYYLEQSKQMPQGSDQEAMMRVYYFWELLYSGQTELCIQETEGEIKKFNLSIDSLTDISKSYFDLLALAYLRLGERENCSANHTQYSCLIPIQKQGQHTKQKGSQQAIEYYGKILEAYPEDLESKWLLNLAYMTLGKYPNEVPQAWLIPGLEIDEDFAFRDVAMSAGVAINGLSGSCCIEDFNNDGLLDIITSAYGYEEQLEYLVNQGNGQFKNMTDESELKGLHGGLNLVHADYNNDGLADVLVLRGGWLGKGGNHPNSLLKNLGNNRFKDVTKSAGLLKFSPGQTATWADFNQDGLLDLFIGNESSPGMKKHPCELYLNLGNDQFEEVTKKAFVKLDAFVKSVVAGDVNNDGYPDLFISILGGDNILYENIPQADGSIRFKNSSSLYKVQKPTNSFTSLFFDYNNDCWEDLLVLAYDVNYQTKVSQQFGQELLSKSSQCEKSVLYENTGKGSFVDVTEKVGLDVVTFGMGANFGDFDNDGYQDILIGTGTPDYRSQIPNRAFRNVQGKYFEEVTYAYGLGNIQKGHGVGFGDFDNDGDQDIYMVLGGAFEGDDYFNALYENRSGNSKHWINLKLEGNKSNRMGFGARIEVSGKDSSGNEISLYRSVGTGGSFGSSSGQVEIGLGKMTQIETISVNWSGKDSSAEVYTQVPIDAFVKILEGQNGKFERLQPTKFSWGELSSHNHQHHHH